jgi:DNA-binding winged helix-turn-helix (wHTH) protein
MRNQRIVCDMADRPEALSVRSGARTPALASREFPAPSIRRKNSDQKNSDQPEASGRIAPGVNNIAELKIQIDGLPVLFRFPLDGGPTETASGVVGSRANIYSRLSVALGKIVDQIRRSARREDGSPLKPALTIVEMGSDTEPAVAQTALRVGPLNLDLLDRTAKRGARRIDLRPREFQLLRYMMERSGKLLTRAELFRDVWHYKFVPQTNLVDVQLGRLRRKVDGPNEPPMIRNVRGAGFVMEACPLSELAVETDQTLP